MPLDAMTSNKLSEIMCRTHRVRTHEFMVLRSKPRLISSAGVFHSNNKLIKTYGDDT